MPTRIAHRPITSALLLSAGALLLVAFLAACGGSASSTATTAPTPMATTGAATESTPSTSTGTTASPGIGAQAGSIGACLQENTTSQLVQDLRNGNTDSATEIYRTCLETALPPALVSQLTPIIQQTATCAETASKNLTDAQMQQIENGDQATIRDLSQSTLTCVSDQLGVPLQ